MYLFKTSGKTFESVIKNQKHAFLNMPSDWFVGETILVSKNKKDCSKNEKQISYTMRLKNIRKASENEISQFWPNNIGRWNYIADCEEVTMISKPFDLSDILSLGNALKYRPVMTFRKISSEDEKIIVEKLK